MQAVALKSCGPLGLRPGSRQPNPTSCLPSTSRKCILVSGHQLYAARLNQRRHPLLLKPCGDALPDRANSPVQEQSPDNLQTPAAGAEVNRNGFNGYKVAKVHNGYNGNGNSAINARYETAKAGPTDADSTPTPAAAAAPEPAAPAAPAASVDGLQHPPGFVARRLIVFAGILLGYTCLYLNRGTLTYSAPVMVQDLTLGLSKTDIGAMTSAFPAAYGLSKFAGGMLGAAFSPRLMLAMGLMATSVINIAFGFTTGVFWWTCLWALNGGLQGIGAPACAMLLTRWFAASERGTYWGLWNISTNLGGFLSPIVVGALCKSFGWQWGMMAPGAFGLAAGMVLLVALKDKPEDAGFPPVEPVKAATAAEQSQADKKQSAAAALGDSMKEVVSSWRTWLLAVTYFFVYLIRQGCTSWLVFYLLEVKGAVDAAAAALTVSGLELGGLLGGTLSGVLSDKTIRAAKSNPNAGLVGRRVQICMAYTVACIGVLMALKGVPAGAGQMQWLVIAALGFTIYGPQMLIGLCGAELISPKSVGASQGILGLISYMGAAGAGIPLSYLQVHYGWNGYFTAMIGACVISLALMLPLANAKSYVQTQQDSKQAA